MNPLNWFMIWLALLTQLTDIPGDMNVAAVLEVVVNAPGSSHTRGGCHLDLNYIVLCRRYQWHLTNEILIFWIFQNSGWGAPLLPSPCVNLWFEILLLFQPCPDFHWNQAELGLRRVDFDVGSAGREGRGLHRLGREHWLGSAIRDFFLKIYSRNNDKMHKRCQVSNNFWRASIILSKVIKTICSEIFWINNVNCFWTTTTTWICFQAKIVWANNIEEKSKIKNDLKIIFLTDWLSLLIRCQTEIEFSFYLSFFS